MAGSCIGGGLQNVDGQLSLYLPSDKSLPGFSDEAAAKWNGLHLDDGGRVWTVPPLIRATIGEVTHGSATRTFDPGAVGEQLLATVHATIRNEWPDLDPPHDMLPSLYGAHAEVSVSEGFLSCRLGDGNLWVLRRQGDLRVNGVTVATVDDTIGGAELEGTGGTMTQAGPVESQGFFYVLAPGDTLEYVLTYSLVVYTYTAHAVNNCTWRAPRVNLTTWARESDF